MAENFVERPPDAAKWENHVPPGTTAYTVKAGDDWASLASGRGIDAWGLIDLNFPGLGALNARNHQLATRHVNWYLRDYVGCSVISNRNYAFSTNITGGKGVHKRGVIFLPPKVAPVPTPTPPPAPAGCEAITIPPIDLPMEVRLIMNSLGAALPKNARCLSAEEVPVAKSVYGESINYDDVYISDGVGASKRAVTTAIPYESRWIVLLNLGSHAYNNPLSSSSTLIHELAHAWQSQHHRQPWRYMVNCVACQAAAASATLASKALDNPYARVGLDIVIGPVVGVVPNLGPADAYSYVPGKGFAEYAGEQNAQQIEDFFAPPTPPAGPSISPAQRNNLATIVRHVKNVAKGAHDPENERSLANIRYAHQTFKGVVWHE